ncbi:MAG: GNAT family acetyltransferase [Treponema sp.]|nr:GNAT family acetyltransferase [Treponema sp.]HAC32740.1 GNAT family acetyltransferase [Treponema sp.]
MSFDVVNIYDILSVDENIFVKSVKSFTSVNEDIENFLKESAIGFAKRKQAVTYLVFKDKALAGYFTIATKTFEIKASYISKTMSKKLERVCQLDEDNNCYRPSAILIAQLGKNFSSPDLISGNELLQIAMETVLDIQYMAGGVITFLECENKQKLLNFYHSNDFKEISIRNTKEDKNLVQLYKLI